MKVVTPHKVPDFDGFAAAYAFKKLNPDFEIVISGRFQQNLDEFLHLFEFEYLSEKEIKSKISDLVIVDTGNLERIGKQILKNVDENTPIEVYDHHPFIKKHDEQLKVNLFELGSITTYFVLKIKEKNIDINEDEATLFAIAIYEDTGNFLYSTTKPEDLEAAKFLIEKGAKLDYIQEFTSLEINMEQKNLMHMLSDNIEIVKVGDLAIAIAKTEIEKFIGGLNIITTKLWEFENYDTLISVVRMGRKVFLVARTKSQEVNIKKLMEGFGGGGHIKAGSATLENVSVDEVVYKLKNMLPKVVKKMVKAKDIMTSPVRTVLAYETIAKVYELMKLTGHGGFPVIDGNKLVGIVTRKAVDKAMRHGFEERPIKSIMNTKLITVHENDSISKVKKIMLENDIGRIPVLNENNLLVGIITRTDLLNADFKNVYEEVSVNFFEDVKPLLMKNIPNRFLNLLRLLGTYGDDCDIPIYVVGGFVRDLFLGIENFDIDLVVEGNGMEFAKYVAKQLDVKVVEHEKFLTASLFFKDGFRIDVATARTEYYDKPAELPKVDISTIKKDLYRRDFTINAMAIKLNSKEFGMLYDFFGSRKDLEEGIIRVLHKLSFVEDPTRMVRAVRFEQRFDFRIEDETLEILKETLEGGYLERVTGQRIRQELEKILQEKDPVKGIKRLSELNILNRIFPKTYFTVLMEKKLKNMFLVFKRLKNIYSKNNIFYAVLRIFLEFYDVETLKSVMQRYGLPKKFVEELKKMEKRIIPVIEMIKMRIKFSDIYKILGKPVFETAAHILAYLDDEDSKNYFFEYLERVFTVKLNLSGNVLKEKFKIKSSPEIGKIMGEIFCMKLDNPYINEMEKLKEILGGRNG
ncbi:tRNA nucleotidyltransferase [Thermosipho melanesiensis]|uniref:CBS domain containing protein n=2 Tax=Thermosipho melanesiensis TaxID=46541 RepID=A6LMX1_THEM4|nr:CBS domain-containing protein [Thermosipho melanesiensis]ABR31272.1 CBS domain containing protein [Thermosipho melanesiensis BI429]APT74353.1 tRNA nucleotidyltransferase [Thermosipho melanesiensis]OOC36295.1 tRNA nucleotidyltransferase [Thermosipho melanesiensis]OOC37113.1 tRNA nucleotidyltransferase [Thermosipho melanesiensis]OOC37865.1 tRNA nucleotidyltransferase [Thermosipho melanesiensis]